MASSICFRPGVSPGSLAAASGDRPGRRFGSLLALTDTALEVAPEPASIPIKDRPIDSIAASIVDTIVVVATALSPLATWVAGMATVRATNWLRFVRLVTGLWLLAMVGLAPTRSALRPGRHYGLRILVLGHRAPHTAPPGRMPPGISGKHRECQEERHTSDSPAAATGIFRAACL